MIAKSGWMGYRQKDSQQNQQNNQIMNKSGRATNKQRVLQTVNSHKGMAKFPLSYTNAMQVGAIEALQEGNTNRGSFL